MLSNNASLSSSRDLEAGSGHRTAPTSTAFSFPFFYPYMTFLKSQAALHRLNASLLLFSPPSDLFIYERK